MSRRGDGMSERVLWLRLCVTGPTPECGEIVGLRIVDRQAHRTVFDAFFHPVREDGWKSVPAGGVNVDLSSRLPLSIYVDGIERILSGATLLRGEHVARDVRFLRAAGVHLEDQVVERSVMAERHKRLASGIAVPTRAGTGLAGPSRWGEKTHPLPETNPSITHLQRKERTRNANPTSACAHGGHSGSTPLGDRGSDVVDEPIRVVTGRGASTMPDESPASNSSPSVIPVDSIQRSHP